MKKILWVAAVAVLLASCSKCGKGPSASKVGVDRYLSKGSAAVVMVPDLGRLGQKLKGLESLKVANFAAGTQGFSNASQWADGLVAGLGVDIRSKDALEKAGLDPARGLGVSATLDGSIYAVVAVKDEAKFKAALLKLAGARLGAGVPDSKKVGELTLNTYAAATGGTPRVGYLMVGEFALLGMDETVPKLTGWAKLPEGDSLANDPAWAASLGRLPREREVLVYMPPGSPVLRGPFGSAALSLALAPDSLVVTVDGAWRGDKAALAMLAKQDTAALLPFLPADAFLVGRYAGDPATLKPFATQLFGPYLEKAFSEGGFDPKSEVFDNLKPGAVFGLSLAPTAKMGGMPALDVRSTNPFAFAHLSGVALPKDAAKVGPTLEKVATISPKFGAKIEKTDRSGQSVFVTSYAAGEGVHFAAQGDKVFFGSPLSRIDALLSSKGDGPGPVSDAQLKGVLDSRSFAVVVDLQKLSKAVRDLPNEAWGIGGAMIKAPTVRWLDATDDLKAITIGLEAKGGDAVQAQLVLKLGGASAP